MPISTYIFVLVQLVPVSYLDIKTKKIANFWPVLNILAYLFNLYLFPDQYPLIFTHFLYSIGFLVIGFMLFLMKIMGPGDAKYLASIFLLIVDNLQATFFFQIIYLTILAGSILLIFHAILNFDKIKKAIMISNFGEIKGIFGTKFTYAPIILISWMGFGWKINIFSI